MLAKERQNRISQLMSAQGSVNATDLAATLSVSLETVRRDLLEMERAGMLVRVHGGAMPIGETKTYQPLQRRTLLGTEEKIALAKKAVELVREGDMIAVDSGSTATCFARELKNAFRKLTVVTYSLDVFTVLNGYADCKVLLCGGKFVENENAFCGNLTLEALRSLHVKKAFICPAAISMQGGIGDSHEDMLLCQKGLLGCGDEVYVLSKSNHFDRRALYKIDDAKREYTYITDGKLSDELYDTYVENGYKIIRA